MVSTNASSRITLNALEKIKDAITEARQNEVMFCGTLNNDGFVDTIIVAARGNESAVPALEAFMEKGDVIIHNHPGGYLKPSNADLNIASMLGKQGIGFFIIDNNAENIYVVAEPILNKKREPIDTETLAENLLPDGKFSKLFEYYEIRESQVDMLKDVVESFNNESIIIAEAGTGVGKSIAYLLPSFQWAINNEERVVVSTNTINLQHQLLEKDIPLAKKILNTDIKSALIKGRSNYLCFRKYYEFINENSLFSATEKNGIIEVIKDWASVTETGDKADLPIITDYSVWSDICSDSDYCLGLYCHYREKCFVIKARKNAALASILVVNHHLLLSDLSTRNMGAGFNGTAVLPLFRHTIVDEAHNLESAATSYFSETLSKGYIIKSFRKLYSKYKTRIFGIYAFLVENSGINEKKVTAIPETISEIIEAYDNLEKEAEALLADKQNLKIEKTGEFDNLFQLFLIFKKKLSGIYLVLDELSQNIEITPEDDSRVYELFLIKSKVKELISISEILTDEREEYVSWIEKGKNISFILTPLDVSNLLREALYENLKTIVLTSATLSIKGDFEFWKKRVGISDIDRKIAERFFPSPFDYAKYVMLTVPTDIKDPSDNLYTEELSVFIKNMVITADGGALILFTSYSMLMEVYNIIKEDITKTGITILRQGEFDRFKIQKIFNEDKRSILLATDSFWEGIDSPGETLKMVIICRLPFKVPSDPVIKSRIDKIEKQGGNSFKDYLLPEAVIKLKQGFGRLMRRKDDTGIVVITDNRIIKKSYGQIFLSSLPKTLTYYSESKNIENKVEDFLFSKK
ncbi:MAG: helicase c2 [Spirochaetaceae bacterium]|nr:helicase c2 [Spirochaetaceae bacterium]